MKGIVFGIIVFTLWAPARSMQADLALQQLNHKGWTVADGAPGAIYAIAQTTDGTLWLGGPSGLSRFDGLRFVRYDGTGGRAAEFRDIKTLTAAPDGSLWIGYALGGIGVLRKGTTLYYDETTGLPRGTVNNITIDKDGVTYAAVTRGLYRLAANKWNLIVLDPSRPRARVSALTLDRAGNAWALTGDRLWVLRAGQPAFQAVTRRNNTSHIGANALAGDTDGRLWALNLNQMGSVTRVDARGTAPEVDTRELSFGDLTTNPGMTFDRAGNLWLGGGAVRRLAAPVLAEDLSHADAQLESFSQADGLTGGSVNCFFEDREGNMWVGTYAGLDRFSRGNIRRISNTNTFGAAVAGDNGTVWINAVSPEAATRSEILEMRDGAVVRRFPSPHFTSAYRSPTGAIWFGGRSGLARVESGRLLTIPLPAAQEVQALVEDSSGAMWVSISGNSVWRFAQGQWTPQGNLPGVPHAEALATTTDNKGRLWFGYPDNRIVRIDGSTARSFGSEDGLDIGNVTAIAAHEQHVWIGGDRGLVHFDGARFAAVLSATGNPFTGISGIVELKTGDLWLNGNLGIVHLSPLELNRAIHEAGYRVRPELFDRLDGLQGYARQVRPSPSAFEGTDGRVWFATQMGLVAIDPAHIERNALAPPVTIWSVDGRSVQNPAPTSTRLPMHTTSVRIEYTAASLSQPERVHFRYKLDGVDPGWQDVDDRREATYTNLGPGRYAFHVIASNNDGVWNNTGASIAFSIDPAFNQTRWFYGLCALAGLLVLWMLYVMRIRQVSAQVHGRLEERLAERERIARELHDTLLQSVQGLVLRFRAAVARLPHHEPARAQLEGALDRADDVLVEGRDRVKQIRSSRAGELDLVQAISSLGEELAAEQPVHFKATVEGTPRELHPIVREEVIFIAREALVNAFRHAAARQIEAEITYSETELRLRIRDDGRGIDLDVLRAGGRAGHWGLMGMRERARKIHATLTVWSKPGAGTEIDVHMPARIAYQSAGKISRLESLVSLRS